LPSSERIEAQSVTQTNAEKYTFLRSMGLKPNFVLSTLLHMFDPRYVHGNGTKIKDGTLFFELNFASRWKSAHTYVHTNATCFRRVLRYLLEPTGVLSSWFPRPRGCVVSIAAPINNMVYAALHCPSDERFAATLQHYNQEISMACQGSGTVKYINVPENGEKAQSYFNNYHELQIIKQKWDPSNIFNVSLGIAPLIMSPADLTAD